MKLCEELFAPHTFRVLEKGHPVYNQQYNLSTARRLPGVMGLSNGARELVLLVPGTDPARDWQLRKDEASLQLGANLYLYSVDRDGMTAKGITHWVTPDPAKAPKKAVTVGRVQYDGNWNPEPAGWDRLAAVMHNDYDTALMVRPLDPATDSLDGVDVLHLTGTEAATLTEASRAAIVAFADAGGLLLIDAAAGNAAFAESAEGLIATMFGDAAVSQLAQPIPADDKLFADVNGWPKLTTAYRLDAKTTLGNARDPLLRGIDRDGKRAIIYSAQDLSVGLVGMPRAGIIGYAPETATALVARALAERPK